MPDNHSLFIHSAGLIEAPHEIVDFVRNYLTRQGANIDLHQPKILQKSHLESADLAIAMDVEHQHKIHALHNIELPLFSTVAYGLEEPIPDVCDVVADWRNNNAKAKDYGEQVMDYIFHGMPGVVNKVDELGKQGA